MFRDMPVAMQVKPFKLEPCQTRWRYDYRLDTMANINGNILTINACRSMGAIEHVRVDGSGADKIKSFTVGERAYVLDEVDRLKSQLAAAQGEVLVVRDAMKTVTNAARVYERERDQARLNLADAKRAAEVATSNARIAFDQRDQARRELPAKS